MLLLDILNYLYLFIYSFIYLQSIVHLNHSFYHIILYLFIAYKIYIII